jgi:hypothetical protein
MVALKNIFIFYFSNVWLLLFFKYYNKNKHKNFKILNFPMYGCFKNECMVALKMYSFIILIYIKNIFFYKKK